MPFLLPLANIVHIAASTYDAFITEAGDLFLLKEAKLTKVETTLTRLHSVALNHQTGCVVDE